jgi:hyperosmotically inducible protein
VKRIEGVEKVVNNIEVLPTSMNDDQIRRAAYRAIYGNDVLSQYQVRAVPPIHIIVNNGHITLEGVVARQMEKQIAGMQANGVHGAFSVTNNLAVEEPNKKDDKKK